MWNDGASGHDTSGFFAFGHGLFGFHGLLWLVLLAIIIGAGIALIRDWRQEQGVPKQRDAEKRRSENCDSL